MSGWGCLTPGGHDFPSARPKHPNISLALPSRPAVGPLVSLAERCLLRKKDGEEKLEKTREEGRRQAVAGGKAREFWGTCSPPPRPCMLSQTRGQQGNTSSSPHLLASLIRPGSQTASSDPGVTGLSKGVNKKAAGLRSFSGGSLKCELQSPGNGAVQMPVTTSQSPTPILLQQRRSPGPGSSKKPQPCSQSGKLRLAALPGHLTILMTQ